MSKSRGALLLFEGIDRSGKSSQSKALLEALRDHKISAELMSFPDRNGKMGAFIGSYLEGREQLEADTIHLLFAADRFEARTKILKHLENGVTVILDRYAHSGAAFTMAKSIDGLDKDWCQSIERGRLPSPDAIFYMDLPIDIAFKRAGFGREKYETVERQTSVKNAYSKLMTNDDWCVVVADRQPEIISREILSRALSIVASCRKGRSMRWLWSD